MTATLLDLRNACKARASMSGSLSNEDQFIPDSEWNGYINASVAEFHDLVTRRNVDFFTTGSIYTVTSPNYKITLPSDFTVLRGVDRNLDGNTNPGQWYNLRPFTFQERNFGNTPWYPMWRPADIRYRIIGNELVLQPSLVVSGIYKMWYIPSAPVLVNDTDTFDDQRYWWEYVVVDVAIKALQKEESDVSVLMAQKAALAERIRTMASDRDFGSPEQIGGRGGGGGGGWGGLGWGGGW